MTKARTAWLLLGILWLASCEVTLAKRHNWKSNMRAARKAYQRGQYAEAEKSLLAALQQAQKSSGLRTFA